MHEFDDLTIASMERQLNKCVALEGEVEIAAKKLAFWVAMADAMFHDTDPTLSEEMREAFHAYFMARVAEMIEEYQTLVNDSL